MYKKADTKYVSCMNTNKMHQTCHLNLEYPIVSIGNLYNQNRTRFHPRTVCQASRPDRIQGCKDKKRIEDEETLEIVKSIMRLYLNL